MKKILYATVLALLALASPAIDATEGSYYSPKGKFRITVPERWKQVDYFTVDAILKAKEGGESILDYDAVFADTAIVPFFKSSYLILTVDQVPALDNTQIDSVLGQMRRVFGSDVRYFPVGDFLAQQKSNEPNYDPDQKVVSVLSEVIEGDQSIKRHLFMMKFYEGGIANFFCYAPDSLFTASVPLFQQIVGSLTYGEPSALAPKSEVKIADIENRSLPEGKSSSSSSLPLPWIIGGAALVIVAIFLFTRRKSA